MNKVDLVESSRLRADIPPFRPGDQVKVFVKVREGQRTRDQMFEGVVISRRGGGLRESFTVRKISFGVGVERTFPLHAPLISKIEVVRHGRVRRAKLYYLRELSGRHAKINERRTRIPTAGAPTPVEEITPELSEEELELTNDAAEGGPVEVADMVEKPDAADAVAESTDSPVAEADAGAKSEAPADATAE